MHVSTGTDKMLAHKENGVGWMVFNQPEKRNAVSYEMWLAVPKILAAFADDPEVRVVVMKGAGDAAFISGADISQFEEKRGTMDAVEAYEKAVYGAHTAMAAFEKPLIAMIKGWCVGGGVAVAIDADMRIASDDSRFGIPAAKLGLGYGFPGVKKLMDLVGPAFTKEIFFTAKFFTAAQAYDMGLVNRVVPAADLEATVRDYAETIAGNAPLTVKAVKATVNEGCKDPAKRDLDRIEAMVKACFASEDYVEGRRAFMEKRKPAFKGA